MKSPDRLVSGRSCLPRPATSTAVLVMAFGLRRDAEDGVGGHAAPGFFVGPADRVFVHRLAVLKHQRDDAGDSVLVNVAVEERVDTAKPLRCDFGLCRNGCRGKKQ